MSRNVGSFQYILESPAREDRGRRETTISCSSGGSRCKAISKQEGVYHFGARIFAVAGADGNANFDAVAGIVAGSSAVVGPGSPRRAGTGTGPCVVAGCSCSCKRQTQVQ